MMKKKQTNYNSKREDLEEEDQGEDERNVILLEKRRDNYKLNVSLLIFNVSR